MNKRVKITSANFFFMIFSLIFLLAQVYLLIFVAFGYGKNLVDNVYLTVVITEFLFILIPSIIYALVKKLDIREVFRLRRVRLKPLVLILVISVPAYMVANMLNSIVVYLLQFLGNVPQSEFPVPKTIPELLFGILIIGVLPGICEEVLNRGIMLNAYETRGTYKAVIITGLFFGVFHFDITNFMGPTVLGIMLGYYAVRTNSIFAPMFAHFLNNTIAEILTYTSRNEPASGYIKLSGSDLFTYVIIGIGSLFAVYWLIKLFNYVTKDTAVIHRSISTARDDARAILTHYPNIIVLSIYTIIAMIYLLMIIFS